MTTVIPDRAHGTVTGYNYYRCRCERCTAKATATRADHARLARSLPTPEHVHGTTNGYRNYGCRCEPCTTANLHAWTLATKARTASIPESVHGTLNGYNNYGCRCDRCKAARSGAYMRTKIEPT